MRRPSRRKCDAVHVCTGDSEWDDYRLLHHFDEGEALDELT
jgi:hypothetical protein